MPPRNLIRCSTTNCINTAVFGSEQCSYCRQRTKRRMSSDLRQLQSALEKQEAELSLRDEYNVMAASLQDKFLKVNEKLAKSKKKSRELDKITTRYRTALLDRDSKSVDADTPSDNTTSKTNDSFSTSELSKVINQIDNED